MQSTMFNICIILGDRFKMVCESKEIIRLSLGFIVHSSVIPVFLC